MTPEEHQTIIFLKTELEKTFLVLNISKEREDKAKQKIENLQWEIKYLKSLMEKGNYLISGQNNRAQE